MSMNVLIKKTTKRAKKVGVAFNIQRKQMVTHS